VANKPSYEVGSSSRLKLSFANEESTNDSSNAKQVWSLSALDMNDDDVVFRLFMHFVTFFSDSLIGQFICMPVDVECSVYVMLYCRAVILNVFWPMDPTFLKKYPKNYFAMPTLTPHEQPVEAVLHIGQ